MEAKHSLESKSVSVALNLKFNDSQLNQLSITVVADTKSIQILTQVIVCELMLPDCVII